MKIKNFTDIVKFTNREDMIDYIKNTSPENRSREVMPNFCDYSWEDTLKMLKEGWGEGIKEIDIKADVISQIIDNQEIVYNRDVMGEYLDIGSYLEGIPECWFYSDIQIAKKEGLKITVNLSAHCNIKQEQIKNKGAVVMALIDRFYDKYFLDIDLINPSINCMGKNIISIFNISTLNGYDRDMLAFIICNPAYLRRVNFAIIERICKKSNCNGYGSPRDIEGLEGIYIPIINNSEDYLTLEQSANKVSMILNNLKEGGEKK